MKKLLHRLKAKLFKKHLHAPCVHICHNDKFIAPFVDFLNRNFPASEHLIVCTRSSPEFPFPQGDNVIEVSSLSEISIDLARTDKIIFHSLFNGKVKFLNKNKHYLKKSHWVIWGGDLYSAKRDRKNDYVRRHFANYLAIPTGDIEVLEQRYHIDVSDKYQIVQYVSIIPLVTLDEVYALREQHNSINIQINNSCCSTTLEVLRDLAPHREENIHIYTILSYGELQYKEEIIRLGQQLFGEKFHYLDQFLSPADYAQHLATLDIMIMAQDRQQGIGNLMITSYYGCKMYIKSEISTYQMMATDLSIFDTNSIKTLSFEDFIYQDPVQQQRNRERGKLYFDEQQISSYWKQVFDK